MKTNLWNHHPNLSSPPVEKILGYVTNAGDKLDEYGLFKLQNGNYLYIHFCGTEKNLSLGFTELEEFATLKEAKHLYKTVLSEDL